MTLLPRRVLMLLIAVLCAAPCFAQQTELANNAVPAGGSSSSRNSLPAAPMQARGPAPEVTGEGSLLFRRYGLGSYNSPLGFGGRLAVSLTSNFNLRVGASYFSYSTKRTVSNIPYTANVRLQSEQAVLDWYPWHGSFHVSPGVLFGNSNRAYGGATVPAGNSFTLNGTTYYSGAAAPVQASGSVRFARTAPMLTAGWGNWVRHPELRNGERHWVFPFEAGVAFTGDPKTALNFSGVVCSSASQLYCENIAADPQVQANIRAERKKLQNDANWLRFYPIISGGVIYRF